MRARPSGVVRPAGAPLPAAGRSPTAGDSIAGDSIADARGGDPAALAGLYAQHAGVLTAVAARILGSRADAEDVIQDLFVGLPEALARYEERGQLGAWLRRLVVRLALGRLRTERRRGEEPLDAGVDPAPRTDRLTADALVDRVALERAVATLPEPLRLVFLLREVEGYAHDEIAALLGISRGASEVRLFRAVRRLRALLA